MSALDIAAAVRAGERSAVSVVDDYLARIDANDGEIHAFNLVTHELAREQAAVVDAAVAAGDDPGPLAGVPIALKDNMCTAGVATTCSSKILEGWEPPYDGTVVERVRSAGAVVVGKTNLDEFAMGSSTENSAFGPTRNPLDLSRVPGGSSGGSAAAVAADFAALSLGSDTGGSIRQPAALTGTVGLKPTYGRVSRYGMIAFASSLDQAGMICRSVADAALMLGVMAGYDKRDSTCIDHPVPDYVAGLDGSLKGLKVGIVKQHFDKGLDAATGEQVREALRVMEAQGAELREVDLPNIDLSVPTYYVVAPAECSSNLSRFDGVRFGHRAENPEDLMDLYCRSRGEGFGPEVRRRILTGTYVLSAGYYDAYYLKAQQVRQLIADDFRKAFEEVDVIAGPTAPTPAFKLGEKTDDPVTMYLNDIYTIGANLAGLPAMSVPCGFAEGLPVGLHLVAPHFAEADLLKTGHQYQLLTDWHTRSPEAYS